MDKNIITRQELYDLVWKESLTAISKRLNISYPHLRKICFAMNVPVPPNGHWSKLRFGKAVEIAELPLDYEGDNKISLYPDEKNINDLRARIFHMKSAIDLIKADKSLPLTVPKKLTNPDVLVIKSQKQLLEYKKDWYVDRGMVRSEGEGLKIRVARENISKNWIGYEKKKNASSVNNVSATKRRKPTLKTSTNRLNDGNASEKLGNTS